MLVNDAILLAGLPATEPVSGVTRVEVGTSQRHALCTCNWFGSHRVVFRWPAVSAALVRAAEGGCCPAAPLCRSTFVPA